MSFADFHILIAIPPNFLYANVLVIKQSHTMFLYVSGTSSLFFDVYSIQNRGMKRIRAIIALCVFGRHIFDLMV
jgi:hypothetical protein